MPLAAGSGAGELYQIRLSASVAPPLFARLPLPTGDSLVGRTPPGQIAVKTTPSNSYLREMVGTRGRN